MTLPPMRLRIAAILLAATPALVLAQSSPARAADINGSMKATTATAASTTTIVAGPMYHAGAARRWFLGNVYRDLWTTAIRVPILDLDRYAGGLKPLKKGGGMQTKSLRLVAKDGSEYAFRLVHKDHSWSVPKAFKGSVIERMSRDQVSTLHPAAALIASPLLDATGVLHPAPMFVVMPKDAALGEFSKDFAGQLGMIEPYPHVPEDGAGFAGATKIIDSEELLKKLNTDPTQRVDAPAFLTARLTDMFLGDWDRHPGQWKWARMPASPSKSWVPISRDRDMVFVTYEGVVSKIGGLLSPVSVPFSGRSANVHALTWNSLEMDRRLLGGLTKPVWDSVAAAVTSRLTDDVIDQAVAAMPVEYQASAPKLASALKERRTRLPGVANAFYALVFNIADIHASDEAENATITRVSDGIVEVRVESGKGTPSFLRRFDARETKEIRLYLHGGDDSAVVVGHVQRSIPVWVIGGNGTNWLVDSSTVAGKHHQAHLYDVGTVEGVTYGKDTLFNRRPWEKPYGVLEPPDPDRGHAIVPNGGISADRGMGITPRIGFTRYDYGIGRRPYASLFSLEAAYATGVGGYRIVASADQRLERSRIHFTEMARISTLELIHYYGLGNTASDSGPLNQYFGARQRQLLVNPAIALSLGARSDLSVGPVVQYSNTDSTPGRLLSTVKPYGFGSFGEAGVRVNLHQNTQDRALDPTQRFLLDLTGSYYPAVWDVKHPFEVVALAIEGAHTFPMPMHPMLVFRTGGKKVFGDFPFYEAAFIGGNHTTRYMEAERYGGDASLFGSTELRIPVTAISILVPLDMGIVGLADGGRVYVNGTSPGGWHSVLGGGLWFSLRNDHVHVVTITMANERGHPGVHFRTGLGF